MISLQHEKRQHFLDILKVCSSDTRQIMNRGIATRKVNRIPTILCHHIPNIAVGESALFFQYYQRCLVDFFRAVVKFCSTNKLFT